MKQILVYGDSLSWGLIPLTRERMPFDQRWPNILERRLVEGGHEVRVIEDCLNGRRTVWDDPYKSGRNGRAGLSERCEVNSPLALVILMLGTNDFQSMHPHTAWHSAQGISALVSTIRQAPVESGMPVPGILIVAPPPAREPKGPLAPKFDNAIGSSTGLADEYAKVAAETGCHFFDAGSVIDVSDLDGIHLDAASHATLGRVITDVVAEIIAD